MEHERFSKHTQGKGGPDKIFRISGMAKARAAEVGKENIINATTGAFLDANGQLITMKTVEEVVKTIPFRDSAEYASIEGTPGFVNAAIDGAFREYRPNGFIGGVATPGGTGGLHHAVYNYLEPGDTVLTMDRYWQHTKVFAGNAAAVLIHLYPLMKITTLMCRAVLKSCVNMQKNRPMYFWC